MIRKTLKRIYAAWLLVLLVSAHVGHAVHIHTEDPLHFAAFSGDLVPDNGADCGVSERCIACNFNFHPFLLDTQTAHEFYFELLVVLQFEATSCKLSPAWRLTSLRAPPAA